MKSKVNNGLMNLTNNTPTGPSKLNGVKLVCADSRVVFLIVLNVVIFGLLILHYFDYYVILLLLLYIMLDYTIILCYGLSLKAKNVPVHLVVIKEKDNQLCLFNSRQLTNGPSAGI